MKIAVVGCGALGSFYGAQLCRSGHEVHCLLRSDFDAVSQRGVRILSVAGDFCVRPHCARVPEDIGIADGVLIGLKTTANHQFARLLPPLVGPATAVVTLQNGLGNEEALAAQFGPDRVLGGLCFVCLNRLEPGLIQHSAHGSILLGEFQRPAQTRTRQWAGHFAQAGVPCAVSDDLARAHWEKLVWNIPFNGLGVAGTAGFEAVRTGHLPAETILASRIGLDTQRLLSEPRWEKLVRALMREVILTGRALGHALEDHLAEDLLARTRCMGAYRASTLIDFERGHPLELESLFLIPWRMAQRAGVDTPCLAALCHVLAQLDPGRPSVASSAPTSSPGLPQAPFGTAA